jgi:hypothetical protein
MINCDLLRELELGRAEELCRLFFPNGKKMGGEWILGDVSGALGNSLGIQLTGAKAGLWYDRATGEGGNLVKLICLMENMTFPQAVGSIECALGINLRSGSPQLLDVSGRQHQPNQGPCQRKAQALKLSGIATCLEDDLQRIATLRSIPIEGLRLASERKLLFRYWYPSQGQCFVITDDARRNAICRRLDGKPFQDRDPETGQITQKKSKCLKGSEANWPIGIAQSNGFAAIALCEGIDVLSAFWLAYAGAAESLVAQVCMTGASCRIHEDALPLFRGKRVRIFGHADAAGQAAVQRWAGQLRTVQAEVDGFDFSGLVKTDDSPVKDLNDFILADHKRSGCAIEIVSSAFDFALERKG